MVTNKTQQQFCNLKDIIDTEYEMKMKTGTRNLMCGQQSSRDFTSVWKKTQEGAKDKANMQ